MASLCTLALEVICHILCFLSPRDVVRLRLVSQQFCNLTYDIAIWRTLYTHAQLPRPHGPFPSQSLQFLERTLVQSERLAHSWTTQPMENLSTMAIQRPEQLSVCPITMYGRWLVGCESSSKFVVYDLDSLDAGSRPHQLLWESTSRIDAWDASPVVSSSGLLIHIVFRIATEVPWKLLEFCVNGDSLYHTLTLDVPTGKPDGPVFLVGNAPFCYIAHQQLIFHAETRSFYGFPPFKSALIKVPSNSRPANQISPVILLTKTHIITLSHHVERTVPRAMSSTLIQAFSVPTDAVTALESTSVLRLSHEGLTPGQIESLDLIRNSIVDPISNGTSIRFLHQSLEKDNLYFSCYDLLLPRDSSDTVLSMSIDVHEIARVNHIPFASAVGHTGYVESSSDGHVRGFRRFVMPHGISGGIRAPFPIMRFSIDASRDRCVSVLGQISAPQWVQMYDPPWSRFLSFDGVRGRWYYEQIRYIVGTDEEAAVLINIK